MKKIFRLTVHGDSDVMVNGKVFEEDVFLFRSFSPKAFLKVLNAFDYADIEPVSKRHAGDDKAFQSAIRNMKAKLSYYPLRGDISIDFEFGGNQFVRLRSELIPEDEDFED